MKKVRVLTAEEAALLVQDDGIVAVQNVRDQGVRNHAAYRAANADKETEARVQARARFQLDVVEDVGLEHLRQQVRRAELDAGAEQTDDKQVVEPRQRVHVR